MKNPITIIIILLCFCINIVNAQDPIWTIYQSPEKINDYASTTNDLWLASNYGVVRMNKSDFSMEYFNKHNSEIPSDHIQAVIIDPNNNPFIGTYDLILMEHTGSAWEEVEIPSELINSDNPQLDKMQLAPDNTLWLSTSEGLLHYNQNSWSLESEERVHHVEFQANDEPIIATNSGFMKLSGEPWVNASWLSYYDTKSLSASNGDLWFYNPISIGFFDGTQWTEFLSYNNPNFPDGEVVSLTEIGGQIYAIMDNGAYYLFENNSWTLDVNYQLTNPTTGKIDQLIVDGQDTWVFNGTLFSKDTNGNPANGALNPNNMYNNESSTLGYKANGSILLDDHQEDQETLIQFDQGIFTQVDRPFEGRISTITTNTQGDQWMTGGDGLFDGRIFYQENGVWNELAFPDGYSYTNTTDLAVSSTGEVWTNSLQYLFQYDGQNWTPYNTGTSMIHQNPLYLTFDQNDALWYILNHNFLDVDLTLNRVVNGTLTTYGHTNSPIPPGDVSWAGIEFNANGLLYIAVAGHGIYTFDGANWGEMNRCDTNLPDEDFHCMHITINNEIVVGRTNGVSIYDGQTWQNFDHSNSPLPEGEAIKAVATQGDYLLVRTESQGLFVCENFRIYPTTNGTGTGTDQTYTEGELLPTINLHEEVLGGGFTVPAGNGCIATGDIDGDGDVDAIVSGEDSGLKTTIYLNNGDGNFTAVASTLPGVRFGKMALVDVDKDNDLDLMQTGSNFSPQYYANLYLNDGSGNFTLATGTPFQPQGSGDFAFADVDKDGDMDLLMAGSDGSQSYTSLYLNSNCGTFTQASGTPFTVVSGSIAFIDLENDEDQDVIIAGEDDNGNQVTTLYVNDGYGNFTSTSSPFDGINLGDVAVADTDNDGDQDVYISGSSNDGGSFAKISKLYINDGLGNFSVVPNTVFSTAYLGVADFADFDNDGDADLFIVGSGQPSGYQSAIYENNGNNDFTLVDVFYDSFVSAYAIQTAIADINMDNNLDLLILGLPSSNNDLVQKYINSPEVNIILDETCITIETNPTEATFEIEGVQSGYTIEILDASETVVQTLNSSSTSIMVDSRNLSAGFYFLHIYDPANILLSVQTILKQ